MRSTWSTLRSYGISYEARILGGVLGQAAGDAFGLPWEGTPAAGIELDPGNPMPRRNPVWSRGATS
ncbi:MAG TPA: ADP-ribosylglycohydrolase family protein, partial [Acidimicrobiales bacterium]|nr:ADP-ribosylglycohydrolase family protein [Acidimicrobiales bacterium]